MLHKIITLWSISICLCFLSCKGPEGSPGKQEDLAVKSGEWVNLNSLNHWHTFNKEKHGSGWSEKDGIISLDPAVGDGGDLTSKNEYENFELRLEWKIDTCGNSGIMFHVHESEEFNAPFFTGPEMQILDNDCHPEGKVDTHRAGDLFDLLSCSEITVKPALQWNSVGIISNQGKVTFYLNDTKVVEFEKFGEGWKELVANSKFKEWPAFGMYKKGKISLQDHGNKVWFRNIQVREI